MDLIAMTGRRLPSRLALVAAGALTLALVAAGSAANAASQEGPSTAGKASLTGVACPRADWCMAVGSYTTLARVQHSLAQIWDGTSWQLLKPPGKALTGVSCTASSFCLALGGPSGALTWNGRTWHEVTGPQYPASAPSCGSRSLCMVIDGTSNGKTHDVVESWNGRSWHAWWQQTNACAVRGDPCGLEDVSCGSAANCVATGMAGYGVQAFAWTGKHWSDTALPSGESGASDLPSVSCVNAPSGFCLAVGDVYSVGSVDGPAITDAWNPAKQSWTAVNNGGLYCREDGLNVPCPPDNPLSCASATACMVLLTDALGGQYWNGTSWQSEPTIGEGTHSDLGSMSCRGSICLAVGHQTHNGKESSLAELWNGTAWAVLPTPDPA
jgi:hypothetical protein